MFCVIYKFKIKEGFNSQFEQSWADFTDAIYRVRGSLGSRLHKTDDSQVYVAYAQWPSREIFEENVPYERNSNEDLLARKNMIETVDGQIERTYLNVFNDKLKNPLDPHVT